MARERAVNEKVRQRRDKKQCRVREAEGGNAERKQKKYKVPGDEEARGGKILLSERKKQRQKDGLFSLLAYLAGAMRNTTIDSELAILPIYMCCPWAGIQFKSSVWAQSFLSISLISARRLQRDQRRGLASNPHSPTHHRVLGVIVEPECSPASQSRTTGLSFQQHQRDL